MVGLAEQLFLKIPSANAFAAIDVALAELLLPKGDKDAATFICYLSAAVRKGHLCVQINEKGLFPDPLLLDLEKEMEPAIRRGAEKLPQLAAIHKEGDRYYFQRYWKAEKRCLALFQEKLRDTPALKVDVAIKSGQLLLPEQAEAIQYACRNCLTLLTGGPGTGKTYTIGHLLRILLQGIKQPCEIALAAPTGKAAAHLETSLEDSLQVKPKTLHALLNVREGQKIKPQKLTADIIVVDECSMIDLKIMTALLAAVKPGARLILVGDQHQLSPIESGSLFSDFVASSSPVTLKTCLRTELKSIIQLAEAIQEGRAAHVLEQLESGTLEGITYHPTLESRPLVEAALSAFKTQSSFRLLSPLRKGPFGVDALNQNCMARNTSHQIPIIVTRSDQRLGLFNGEVGTLLGDEALFGSRRISTLLLPPYEYAYCLSVYKAQGSEFDEVWIVLPPGSELFGRELLYTALTRARKRVQIWGSRDVILQTIERQSQRLSGITTPAY